MLARIFAFFFLVALASRVLAQDTQAQSGFILAVGKYNLTTAQLLNIPNDPPAFIACKSQCDETSSKFAACNENPDCLCSNETVASLQICEQCMFTFQVTNNLPNTDFRLGSTPILAAMQTTCNATTQGRIMLNKTQIALALPPTWDGPTGIVLPTPALALGVIAAFFLGVGSILILSNL